MFEMNLLWTGLLIYAVSSLAMAIEVGKNAGLGIIGIISLAIFWPVVPIFNAIANKKSNLKEEEINET